MNTKTDAELIEEEDDHFPNDDGCLDHGDYDCKICTDDNW